MSLDLTQLQNLLPGNRKYTAQCPACAEEGADNCGNHLVVYPDGAFACIQFPGEEGKAHRQRINELVGAKEHPGDPSLLPQCTLAITPCTERTVHLPSLCQPSIEEMFAICRSRNWGIGPVGLSILSQRGLLWLGMVWDGECEWPAWIITDSARRNAQARRLDGLPWQGIGGAKAKTMPGSQASWPIGASDIGDRPLVLICEGGPDYCVAPLVAWYERQLIPDLNLDKIAPVCICGAGQNIPSDAKAFFAGKHVRIAIHADPDGWTAAQRWHDQLSQAGARSVDGIAFNGLLRADEQPVKDLADYATLLNFESPRPPLLLADLPGWLMSAVTSSSAASPGSL